MNPRLAWMAAGAAASAIICLTSHAEASALTDCRVAVAESVAAYIRAYHTLVADCLKKGDYRQYSSSCGDHLDLLGEASDQMDAAFVGPEAPCARAVSEGVALDEIHGPACRPAFLSCDFWYSVDDLGSAGDCIACNVAGTHEKLKHDLAFPETQPVSADEHKCMRVLQKGIGKVLRTALKEAAACAEVGTGDCALDLTEGSRFAKARRGLASKAARCRDANGNVGTAGGSLSLLCNSAVASGDDLSACIARAATCQACLAADLATGQQHDCASISGDRACRLELDDSYGALEGGSFMVANEGDSTVTFYEPDGEFVADDLAASSIAAGGPPSELALVSSTNTLFAVSSQNDSVTALDAHLREPAKLTIAASTTTVGDAPSGAAAHEVRQILYVANRGDDSVTMLDAADGSYLHGSLAASTVPVGDAPSAIAVDAEKDVVFVTNSGEDSVTFLDAVTGAPLLGTLELSSFPTCDSPRAMTFHEWWYGDRSLFIACEGDSRVIAINAETGAEEESEYARTLGSAPFALATSSYGGFATLPGTNEVTGWQWDGSFETIDGNVASATLPSAADPSDLALGFIQHTAYPEEEFLLALSRQEDRVQKSPIFRSLGLFGVSAFERSTVEMEVYGPVLSNDAAGVLYARSPNALLFLDADTLEVLDQVQAASIWDFVFDAGRNRLYASVGSLGVAMIDATTGDFVNGTLANSTYVCGCSNPYHVAINPVAGRVYLQCGYTIAYMDADTGACLGSTPSFSPYAPCGMAPDPATGRLLAGGCQNWTFQTSGQGSVLALDAAVPQFVGGTPGASVLATGLFGIYSMEVGPLTHRLYAATSRDLVSLDASTGAQLGQGTYYRTYRSFELDEPNDLLRVIEEKSPVTDASRVAWVNATTLDIDAVLNLGSLPMGIATNLAAGTTTVVTSVGLVQTDPSTAAYRTPDPVLASETFATGHAPSAIVVAPWND
jgi:DNA-binding beta-propeller fold protein YncE